MNESWVFNCSFIGKYLPLLPQGVYFLEKYDELEKYDGLSKSVVFGQKLYFTDQNGPKNGPHGSKFELFSNSEMNLRNKM